MRLTLVPVLAAVLLAVACGGTTRPPLGEIVVYVDTDAPLPPAPGDTLGPDDPLPLFDSVRIEVFAPGASAPCQGCIHEFDLDRTRVNARNASIGVTTPPGVSGYRARVRLFRRAYVELGQPRPDATVESVVALPATNAEGTTAITVLLATDDVAKPRGTLGAPVAAELRTPQGLAGTWGLARRTPCNGAPGEGQACIRGGAYWMGNPTLRGVLPSDTVVLRIAALSPFFLNKTEVTVGRFRAADIARVDDPLTVDRFALQVPGPRSDAQGCSFTTLPENNDDLPVNCITWRTAREFCQTTGGDLPSEAQFQYAASGFAGRMYVWGDDPPSCDDAVFSRSFNRSPDSKCAGSWLDVAGAGARDALVLGDGDVVVDLMANLSELALDRFNLQTEGCWGTGVFVDPVCATPSRNADWAELHTVVGGSWMTPASSVAAGFRLPRPTFVLPAGTTFGAAQSGETGFRCARSAEVPAPPACGALATRCKDGETCKVSPDCASKVCARGVCQAPASTDGVRNGDETDIDCGGSRAPPCESNQTCVVASDCRNRVCTSTLCAEGRQDDGIRNNDETDIDCGGAKSAIPRCTAGQGCISDTDCNQLKCDPAQKKCQPASHSDGFTNDGETGVDCGGTAPVKCPIGQGCVSSADCALANCDVGVTNLCLPP